jgi:L-ascorbate metabolism protein UlaG (beta-lactamase superfamily)
MHIQRLNLDTSWIFTLGSIRILVDPWLIGSEIDGFSWFNEQWHSKEPVQPAELGTVDFILISQSYEDHCHIPTLEALSPEIPILATGKAANRLRKKFPERTITDITDFPAIISYKGLTLSAIHPGRKIDPVYYGVVIEFNGKSIFYASHGFQLEPELAAKLTGQFDFALLITTFTHFKLPAILGGDVNPGKDNALQLCNQLKPDNVIGTHDEKKIGKGLVTLLAKVTYPDFQNISLPHDARLLVLDDYREVAVN